MITNSNYRSADSWRWPLVLILTLLALAAGGDTLRQALAFDRAAIGAGQGWRLLTGHFVHLGWYHTALNAAGLVVLVLLCPQPLSLRIWLQRLLALSLGISLCLYALVPGLRLYVGLSGVIHGLFLLGLVPQALRRDRIAALALLYLVGKLVYEQLAGAPLSDEAAIGGRVITQAHLYGSLVGLAYGLAAGSFSGREGRAAGSAPSAKTP